MNFKWGQFRKMEDLRTDPRYDFQVGHLVGAHHHLCTYLALYGDERGKEIARRAHKSLEFFFETPDHEPLPELPPSAYKPEHHLDVTNT